MTEGAKRYVVVFADSIDTTDVPLNELKSLIRIHNPRLVVKETGLSEVLSPPPTLDLPHNIVVEAPENIVHLARFKQSCIISTVEPSGFLHSIIKRSAYIDSCGPLICVSQMDHLSVDTVRADLTRFIQKWNIRSFALSFYTKDTKEKLGGQPGKLDGLLIDQKRFFLRELPFDQAIRQLQDWPGPGELVLDDKAEVDAQLWGYKDVAEGLGGSLGWTYPEKLDEIYLILYQPQYRLRNALYDLDEHREAKPYWKGIDTTPQRLMGAMLNLAQVQENHVIFEPFAHTGTVLHEAAKLRLGGVIFNDKFETQGAEDNLSVLTASVGTLRSVIDDMQRIRQKKSPEEPNLPQIHEVAQKSLVWKENEPYPLHHSITDLTKEHHWLSQLSPRLFFYFVRRFCVEQRIGYTDTNPSYAIYGRYKNESSATLLTAVDEFVKTNLDYLAEYADTREKVGAEFPFRGVTEIGYAPLNRGGFRRLIEGADVDIAEEGFASIDDSSVDAIVTDPPYGYGSFLEQEAIYRLYRRFFEEAFRVLKPGGRIVMCVLDKVKTGKDTLVQVMTAGVVDLANEVAKTSRVSFVTDTLNPFERDALLLSYWKAQHKLNRGILSFRIHK